MQIFNRIPSGVVFPFAGATAPKGYLLCDGSAVSRDTYGALFRAIGTVHGSGNGTTTFHLPDYRGRFLRGSDNMGTGAASRDADSATRTASNSGGNTGNNVGSVQAEDIKSHIHNLLIPDASHSLAQAPSVSRATGTGTTTSSTTVSGTNKILATGGTETRPQNAAVNYIIKI